MPLMSKAFVKEEGDAEDDAHLSSAAAPKLPAIGKNYITPAGYARLKAELRSLVEVERPEVVKTGRASCRERVLYRV